MRLTDEQLKETIKILTYEFVTSIEKMSSLHQEHLLYSKHELYSKVINLIEFEKNTPLVEDYVKLLENSYEDKMKNQCFEKDLSMSINNHSISKQSQSFDESGELHDLGKSSFDDSDEKYKQMILNHQRSLEITKYNTQNENQDIQQMFECYDTTNQDQCKKQEQDLTPIHKIEILDAVENQSISSSEQVKEQDNQSDSSFEVQVKECYKSRNNLNNTITKISFQRKRYRSYTQEERQQAINYAQQMGIEFTSRTLGIPKKNIARWMNRKQKADKIRGRKPGDPEMELNLTNWIEECIEKGEYLTQTQIRTKAKFFSGDRSFKASKGWLQKYFRRNRSISAGLNGLLFRKRESPSKREYTSIR